MYRCTTHDIRVTAEPFFLEEQSDPALDHYFWIYNITIENHGSNSVTLLSRQWFITNAQGITREIMGPGVVGEQPTLEPGGTFDYASGAPLDTPSGMMRGIYSMIDESGHIFDVMIPTMSLDSPYEHRQHH